MATLIQDIMVKKQRVKNLEMIILACERRIRDYESLIEELKQELKSVVKDKEKEVLLRRIKSYEEKKFLLKKKRDFLKFELSVVKDKLRELLGRKERAEKRKKENNNLRVGDIVKFKKKDSLLGPKRGVIKKIEGDVMLINCGLYDVRVNKNEGWLVWKKC